jgi:nitrous oxidase accessory protein
MITLPGALSASALVVALTAAAAWSSSGTRDPSTPRTREPEVDTGPSPREPAAGAPSIATFDELKAAVADPSGPREIELAPALFRGDLVVKRAITLRGQRGTILEGSGEGTVVTVAADDVTLENLSIRHSGRHVTAEDAAIRATGNRIRIDRVDVADTLFGVSLLACHGCLLAHTRVNGFGADAELRGDGIKLWESHDSVVRGCVVDGARDVVVWYTRRAVVEDNVVLRSRYGTHFMYAHDSVARRNRFERNIVGVFVMYSARVSLENNVLAGAQGAAGMGVGFKESDGVQVRDNWLVANTTGTYLDFTPRTPESPAVFERNVFALNGVALRLHAIERGAIFTGNDFRSNDEIVEVDGGGDALGCDIRGNHFSDYQGYDLNGDGVGDVPYRVAALSSELTDSHPALKMFRGTPALGLVDAIARAVPLLDGRPILSDPSPIVRPLEVPLP